jgi:hypothetical protein
MYERPPLPGSDPDEGPARPSRQGRQAYRPPALVVYGPIAKLTQGTLTTMNDGVGGGMRRRMMMCL